MYLFTYLQSILLPFPNEASHYITLYIDPFKCIHMYLQPPSYPYVQILHHLAPGRVWRRNSQRRSTGHPRCPADSCSLREDLPRSTEAFVLTIPRLTKMLFSYVLVNFSGSYTVSYRILWCFMMVYDSLWWFVMVCGIAHKYNIIQQAVNQHWSHVGVPWLRPCWHSSSPPFLSWQSMHVLRWSIHVPCLVNEDSLLLNMAQSK